MDRIIRQITEHFVSQLPEGEQHYRIEDLKNYGFPPFLVRRIRIELQWNLDESMVLPKTDWANTESEAVQQSWHHFLNAIHAEVQLPASYAKAVIETAVSDIVDMLVQPRKNIPDILFGGEDALSANDIEERTELLVVYPHFAQVLMSYMQRKDKTELSRERCKKIIKQVDQNVTHQYTPLQWAQMLDPLFTLAGPELDSNLLRLFYEDRKMQRTARRFDEMDETVTRAKFIEVLSLPGMLNYKDSEEDSSSLGNEYNSPGRHVETGAEIDKDNPEKDHPSTDAEESTESETDSEVTAEQDDGTPEPELTKPGKQTDEAEGRAENEEIEPEPDFEIQSKTPEGNKVRSTTPDEEDQPASLNDIFVSDAADEDNEAPPGPVASPPDSDLAEKGDEEEAKGEEPPIWMRFMDSDESEESEEQEEPQTEQPAHEDEEYVDEPVVDLRERESKEKEVIALEEALEDDRDYFVNNLFDGSDQAYREALQEIAQKDSWKDASKLIGRTFDRNMVNLYSEAAVDFTDRLHNYFIYKENGN